MWFQGTDASDPDAGVVCSRVTDAEMLRMIYRYGRIAVRILTLIGAP